MMNKKNNWIDELRNAIFEDGDSIPYAHEIEKQERQELVDLRQENAELRDFRDYLASFWERYLNRGVSEKTFSFRTWSKWTEIDGDLCRAAWEAQQKEKGK